MTKSITIDPGVQAQMMAMAHAAMENAHAPYSGFAVGTCVLTKTGHLHAGCNVENAASPSGTCAEEAAIAAMVAAGGAQKLAAVLVMGRDKAAPTPCGACRQRIAEFGDDKTILLVCDESKVKNVFTLGDLLPERFTLKKGTKA